MRIAAIDIGTNSIHMIVVRVRPDLLLRGHRPRKGNGPARARAASTGARSRPRRCTRRCRRCPSSGGSPSRTGWTRSSPSRRAPTREAENGGEFLAAIAHADRHPRRASSRAPKKRGSSIWRRCTASACRATRPSSSTSAAAASRSRAGAAPSVELGAQLQARRHPADRAVRARAIRSRRATSASWCGTSTREIGRYLDQIAARRLRPRHRHVGHDPQPRRRRAAARRRPPGRAAAQPARRRPSSSAALRKAARRARPRGAPARAGPRAAARRPRRGRRRSCSTRSSGASAPSEITLCDLSLREGPRARLHRAAPQADRAGRSLSRRPPPQRHRAGRALQLLAGARAAGGAARRSRSSTRRAPCTALTDREREWLEYAALLHDIGVHISYERHHKHSYYLIKNGDLRGFEPDEIETIALVARYHRQATPKKSARRASAISAPRRGATVRTLAAILRLAESLDRSHAQTVAGVELHDRGDDDLLQLRTAGDAELELWAAARHAAPFERADRQAAPHRGQRNRDTYAEQPDTNRTSTRASCSSSRASTARARRRSSALLAKWLTRRGPPRVRHRMELVRARQGGDQDRARRRTR